MGKLMYLPKKLIDQSPCRLSGLQEPVQGLMGGQETMLGHLLGKFIPWVKRAFPLLHQVRAPGWFCVCLLFSAAANQTLTPKYGGFHSFVSKSLVI